MNKLIQLGITCLAMPFFCLSQTIKIQVHLSDVDTSMMIVKGITVSDTLHSTNGEFLYTRMILSPELIRLIFVKNQQSIKAIEEGNERKLRSITDAASIECFAEQGMISLTCNFSSINSTRPQMTNHSVQDKYDLFRKSFNPLVQMARTIIDSSYTADTTETSKKIFLMLYDRLLHIENDVAEKFVLENVDNAAGAYILYRYCNIDDAARLDSIYQLFLLHSRTSSYLKEIQQKIRALKAIRPGQVAPNFSALSSLKHPLSLSSYRGKFVVIDFWGSWCKPCVEGFPKMKEYYARYKQKVEFIGIACSDQDSTWRSTIKKYQLEWPQIKNGEGIHDLGKLYNVEAYPTKFIIDESGKILYSFVGENETFYKDLEAILE